MATKKLTIVVQHGETKCDSCPGFFNSDLCYDLNYECELYDYSTMRILEIENQEKLIPMSKRRPVTVDFDDLFEDLSYFEQISFLADKLCDQRLEDKLNIIKKALADVEIMDLIRQHRETAIKVLKGEGYEIH